MISSPHRFVARPILFLLSGLLLTWNANSAGQKQTSSRPHQRPNSANPLRVPEGFSIELAAVDPEIRFPMFAAFDDRGRLFVAESSGLDLYAELKAQTRQCRIRMLQDQNGDGYFEKSHVYADQLVFPMGLVWREGKLYVADPPDLVALEDKDNDGRADQRTVVLTGFGHTDNGSLHGLVFGPDGWLYMTMGEPDGYRLVKRDGSSLEGKSGALIRCRADGSDVEVVSRGFENLIEVVFLPGGEIIGTDNWFQRPDGGLRDALVHLVNGGLYPYAPEAGTPQPITGEPLPAISLFPAVAVSGLTICRSPAFPESFHGNLLSAQHNARSVVRHVLTRSGSSFQSDDLAFVTTEDPDFHPSDVLEDADGSVLVVDTGAWYIHHCPTGRIRQSPATGGIYRVRHKQKESLSDPWGLQEDWNRATPPRLAELLFDSRPKVRDKAELQLSERGEEAVRELTALLERAPRLATSGKLARVHAIWALIRMTNAAAIRVVEASITDEDPDIATAAMRGLELRPQASARADLERQLSSPTPELRMAAAFALARCGNAQSLPVIWNSLSTNPDRFFEHALIFAAHQLSDIQSLKSALQSSSARVQQAALLLLDQPPRPPTALTPEMLLPRVGSPDARLRNVALKLLRKHSEWSQHAVDFIRTALGRAEVDTSEQTLLCELILAFEANEEIQSLVASGMSDGDVARRVWLIEMIGQSKLLRLPEAWVKGLNACLTNQNPSVQLQAARTAAALQIAALDQLLLERANDAKASDELRLEAIRAVVQRQPRLTPAIIEFLTARLSATEPLSRLAAAERLRSCQLTGAQLINALEALRGQNVVSPSQLFLAYDGNGSNAEINRLVQLLEQLMESGWNPTTGDMARFRERLPAQARDQADRLATKISADAESMKAKLDRYAPLLNGGDSAAGRDVFFGGKAICSACHAIGDVGGRVGPDLTKIGAVRAGQDLLESILIPSATFAQGYETFELTTRSGDELTGAIVHKSDETIVVRDASSAEHRLVLGDIVTMRRLERSLMPDRLEASLTEQEFRDLMAFLKELK